MLAERVQDHGHVDAVDLSGMMLFHARVELERKGLLGRVTLIKDDILGLTTLDAESRYDRIILLWSIYAVGPSMDEVGTALQRWRTFLKPDGRIIFEFEHPLNWPATLDARHVDGSIGDSEHLLLAGREPFESAESHAKVGIGLAGMRVHKTEHCFRGPEYGYRDISAATKDEAIREWRRLGGTGNECSEFFLVDFIRQKMVILGRGFEARQMNSQQKDVTVLVSAVSREDGDALTTARP